MERPDSRPVLASATLWGCSSWRNNKTNRRYTVLYCVFCTVLYSSLLCYAVLCSAVLYSTLLFSTLLHCTVLYTVYSTLHCRATQHCATGRKTPNGWHKRCSHRCGEETDILDSLLVRPLQEEGFWRSVIEFNGKSMRFWIFYDPRKKIIRFRQKVVPMVLILSEFLTLWNSRKFQLLLLITCWVKSIVGHNFR